MQFYENGYINDGKYLNISFPYSNHWYLQLFKVENDECLFEGSQCIFEHIEGVPYRISVIMLSAKTGKESKLEVLRIGADDFIAKQFDVDEVGALVNAQIRCFTKFSNMLQQQNV